jgi:pimeloyl-ACP methyl ester carboxylesterase
MIMGLRTVTAALMLACAVPAAAAAPQAALSVDPPADAAFPASLEQVRIPTAGLLVNGVLYLASGKGPHPTLLLLHGFPGNEQNLDLAQAARRAGWNVLTFHYRGSWGSPGTFSLVHCTEDAAAALAFLRDPANAGRFRIDPARIAVGGHSLGGMVAARSLADDPGLLGGFLIDPADVAAIGRAGHDPAFLAQFKASEVDGDMPPLNAEEGDVLDQWLNADPRLDLIATIGTLKGRRLAIYSATRGLGDHHAADAAAARKAGVAALSEAIVPTDHSFSDHRIWLTSALLDWLAQLVSPSDRGS